MCVSLLIIIIVDEAIKSQNNIIKCRLQIEQVESSIRFRNVECRTHSFQIYAHEIDIIIQDQ